MSIRNAMVAAMFGSPTSTVAVPSEVGAEKILLLGMREDAPPFAPRNPVGSSEEGGVRRGFDAFSVDLCETVVDKLREADPDLSISRYPVTTARRFLEEKTGRFAYDLLCDPTSMTSLGAL